ncbi:hypothetical protein VP424E501_P0279 [Vibrio phage 424E50-1]|nr:hypothetical protein VP424E501_P0279 [Vibrio phage 424E50-1]
MSDENLTLYCDIVNLEITIYNFLVETLRKTFGSSHELVQVNQLILMTQRHWKFCDRCLFVTASLICTQPIFAFVIVPSSSGQQQGLCFLLGEINHVDGYGAVRTYHPVCL